MCEYLNFGRVGWVDPRVREGDGGAWCVLGYGNGVGAFASTLSFLGRQDTIHTRVTVLLGMMVGCHSRAEPGNVGGNDYGQQSSGFIAAAPGLAF